MKAKQATPFLLLLCLVPAALAAPHVTPLRPVSPLSVPKYARLVSVPKYARLELACDIETVANNLFVPYEASAHNDSANLKLDEDARSGVTADALLLPPGVTNWAKARTQPAFYFQAFAPAEPAPPQHPTDLLLVNGKPEWRVRFAPDMAGTWHCKLRVADKSGTAYSPVLTFTCTASASAGFVRVSPTDSRYLTYDNGSVCAFVGDNFQQRDDVLHVWPAFAAEHNAGGAHCLLRVWIGARNGMEVYGGFANSDGGRTWDFGTGDNACVLEGTNAHSGRFCVRIPSGGALKTSVPVRPNTSYTVTAWVKSRDVNGTVLHVNSAAFNVRPAWIRISYSVTPDTAWLGLAFGADSTVLVDDMAVTGPEGDELCAGDFERHVCPNLRQAFLLDSMVEQAARSGQFLRLVAFDNDDSVFCNVGTDGNPVAHDDANFYGKSNDSRADLPVRRWQAYAVRYLVARYGYSTAVAQWEFCNEAPSYNGNAYAASEAFGRNIHSFAAQGKRMAGTSFYQNNSAPSYVPQFYENPQYPDMDYADVHYYPGASSDAGSFIPFNNDVNFFAVRGFALSPTGGPNGWGKLSAMAHSILPWRGTDPNFAAQQFPVFRVRGKGVWHLSGWFRQSTDARFNGPAPLLKLSIPGLGECAAGLKTPAPQWTRCTATLAVPDNADHIGATLRYEATGLTAGQVEFSGVELTGPDGRYRISIHFNEPRLDTDTAALARFLPLDYTGVSGDVGIGKPLSVGETDYLNNGIYNPDLLKDTQGVWLRHFCWAHLNPSGATVFWWYSPTRTGAGARGWWNFAAAYQRFLADVPLANGRYKNINARSANRDVQIIGQADVTGARAHFFVYNQKLNWHAQAVDGIRPALSKNTVTVRGLPDGAYQVQTWDTVRGVPVSVQTVSCRDKILRLVVRLPEAAIKLSKSAL